MLFKFEKCEINNFPNETIKFWVIYIAGLCEWMTDLKNQEQFSILFFTVFLANTFQSTMKLTEYQNMNICSRFLSHHDNILPSLVTEAVL